MATDLIVGGFLSLGGTDLSAEITGVTIQGMANDVEVPATMTAGKTHLGGALKYQIQIDYLADDSATTTLFSTLWTAAAASPPELAYVVRLRSGIESPTNPQWSGTMVVSGADLGGDVESLSTGSITCLLTAAPTILES